MKELRLLFLPGLGGDQRMFQPLRAALNLQGVSVMPVGPVYAPLLPLEQRSNAMAVRRMSLAPIQHAARRGADLTRSAAFGAGLVAALPHLLCRPAMDLLAAIYPNARPRFAYRHLYAAMARDADPSLFFRAGQFVRQWPGTPDFELQHDGPLIQMHGTADPLFDFRQVCLYRTPEIVIAGGDHLVFARHADLLARRLLLAN